MRILYHLPLSAFARKIRIVLKEKNLEFTLQAEKVWERRPEFMALNAAGEVPVLIEPEGAVLVEHGAIAEYLDEVYREKMLLGLNPADRAEVRRLCAWFDVKMNREVTENLAVHLDVEPGDQTVEHITRLAAALSQVAAEQHIVDRLLVQVGQDRFEGGQGAVGVRDDRDAVPVHGGVV